MKLKPTPPPWYARPANIDERTHIETSTGFLICFVEGNSGDHHEDFANARLMAAAPEMLEALEGIATFIAENVEERFGCYDAFGKRDQINTKDFYNRPELKRLFAVINKATGGDHE